MNDIAQKNKINTPIARMGISHIPNNSMASFLGGFLFEMLYIYMDVK